ncbi:MAG TPA: FAD-dependent oxidoreductase [Vicinamibacterales bacterium]|nr:FAD-dependent oxidoreductase [Vicinamibacterales bacterium]
MANTTSDFVVVGAGCFGAWTAQELLASGHSVTLLDAYGPAHSRASSGGESRVIRMGYGADELYTRWSASSLERWKTLAERTRQTVFHETGVLWLAGKNDIYTQESQKVLERVGVRHERLSVRDVQARYPQISSEDIEWALWEPGSGILMARRSVQALVQDGIQRGLDYHLAHVVLPVTAARGRLTRVVLHTGEVIAGGTFVFACGAWLPKVFPDVLAGRIFPTRQEIFFFAPPPGDTSFNCDSMPVWLRHDALVYGMPDLENRGVKISVDEHGPPCDPDTVLRVPTAEGIALAREHLSKRFPKLKDAPLSETRVCQYENTSNGDFLIDRHPELEDVWIAGGGSGHGFKHGPAVGDYVKQMVTNASVPEPRFSLTSKATTKTRAVF